MEAFEECSHDLYEEERGGGYMARIGTKCSQGLVVVRVRVVVQYAEGRRFSFPLVFSGLGFSPNFLIVYSLYEHNARSGGTPAAPREKDLVWRLVAGGVG